MNMKAEMNAILNEMDASEIDVSAMRRPEGMTETEHREALVSEVSEMIACVATGIKIALTGKDGFKNLKEFDEFIHKFRKSTNTLDDMTERLAMIMSVKISESGDEGVQFLKGMKLEVLDMLKKQITNEGE